MVIECFVYDLRRGFYQQPLTSQIAMNSVADDADSVVLIEGHTDNPDYTSSMKNCPTRSCRSAPRTHFPNELAFVIP
jgi:hypothetical protein